MQPNQYNNQYQQWQGQPTGTNYQTNNNAYYVTNNNPYATQQIPQQQYLQQPMVIFSGVIELFFNLLFSLHVAN